MKSRIAIVDDDDGLRDSLSVLLSFRDYDVVEFGTGEAFLEYKDLGILDVVVLDLRMPGLGGLEVLKACREDGFTMPVIVVTAFGDIAAAKNALKAGALDFLEKPVDGGEMLRLIEQAVSHRREASAREDERASVEERTARLTPREKEILDAVLEGKHNREIAAALELSVRTVEVYKARMMEKMRVSRLAELVRLFARLDIKP